MPSTGGNSLQDLEATSVFLGPTFKHHLNILLLLGIQEFPIAILCLSFAYCELMSGNIPVLKDPFPYRTLHLPPGEHMLLLSTGPRSPALP